MSKPTTAEIRERHNLELWIETGPEKGTHLHEIHVDREILLGRLEAAEAYKPVSVALMRDNIALKATIDEWNEPLRNTEQLESSHSRTIEHLDKWIRRAHKTEAIIRAISELKRYDLDQHGGCPNQHSDGDWVEYEKIQALLKEQS